MTVALFFHGPAAPRAKYEAALGCKYTVVFPPGAAFSASYDEFRGIARDPLPVILAKYAPKWRAPEPLILLAFSAGNWAVKHWLRDAQSRRDVTCFVSIDGLHGESSKSLGGVLEFAKLCQREPDAHRLVVTNSDIDPVKYASTDDGSAWLLDQLGVARPKRDHWTGGPGVYVIDDPGDNRTGAGHVAQLQRWGVEACAEYVGPWLQAMRPTEPVTHPDPMDEEPWRDPELSLGERAVLLALDEADREPRPSNETLARYFEGCERAGAPGLGRWLAAECRAGKRHNHCAAAISYCAATAARPGEVIPHGWRAAALEIRSDAIAAHAWHEVSECRAGVWFPARGDVAVYTRDGGGHVDRVQSSAADGYVNVGANEGAGGAWRAGQFTPYTYERLLGFAAYPPKRDAPVVAPKHELTEAQIKDYTAARDAGIAAAIAEVPWRPVKDGS